jgi:TolB protein
LAEKPWLGVDEHGGVPSQKRPDRDPPPHWRLDAIWATEIPTLPAVSPDGSLVAFVLAAGPVNDIYILPATGGQARRLTTDRPTVNYWADSAPVWSPDGTRIAFVRGFFTDIWIMNPDGTQPVNLTGTPELSEYAPWWSADGIRIFYSADGGNRYVMNADGSGQTLLPGEDSDVAPGSVSPDGTRIAFSSFQSGANKVFVMNADGTDRVRLTDMPGNEFGPSWSPDGARLAFDSDAVGQNDVFVINADGTGLVNITNDAAAVERTGPRAWGP